MSSDVSQVCRFADAQETRIQAANRSNVSCAVMKGLRFAESQESRFQASKRSDMCSALLLVGRFADIQEFCFQAAKRSVMDCVELQGVYLVIVRNGIFRL